MTLATLMIGTTFLLGVLFMLFGCFAIARGKANGGGGEITFLGITVTGKSGATLIFLVGAAFVGLGFGWASTHKEAQEEHTKATVAVEQARTIHGIAEKAQAELIKADGAANEVEQQRTALRASLKAAVSPEKYSALERTTPWLKGTRTWKPPAELMRPLGAVRSDGGG